MSLPITILIYLFCFLFGEDTMSQYQLLICFYLIFQLKSLTLLINLSKWQPKYWCPLDKWFTNIGSDFHDLAFIILLY